MRRKLGATRNAKVVRATIDAGLTALRSFRAEFAAALAATSQFVEKAAKCISRLGNFIQMPFSQVVVEPGVQSDLHRMSD